MDNRTPSERFWVKVDRRGDDECWPWIAGLTATGYGTFKVNNRSTAAHRFAYEDAVGPIPAGLVIDHQCHNRDHDCPGGVCAHRKCVNPSHLEPTSHKLNLLNSSHTVNHASATAVACPAGHPYTPENTGRDGTDRCCRTCKRQKGKASAARRNAERRERYALLRAAGSSPKEARSASLVKVGIANGNSADSPSMA
jgi:hypothetical protein